MIISPELTTAFNDSRDDEYNAYFFYRAAGNFLHMNGYGYAAKAMDAEAANELEHARKLETFMRDTGLPIRAQFPGTPDNNFSSLPDVMKQALTIETELGRNYDGRARRAFPISIMAFLEFTDFVRIQHQSVSEWRTMVDRLNQINEGDAGDAAAIQELEEQLFGFEEGPMPI